MKLESDTRRVYVDTSVFGGYFEPEFQKHTRAFFDCVYAGRFKLLISQTTIAELQNAPRQILDFIGNLPVKAQEFLQFDPRIDELRDAYLAAKVVTAKSSRDAEHIAWASVCGAAVIVSWNFKHIVNMDRIRGYHSVNLRYGYPLVPIHAPSEVITYAD